MAAVFLTVELLISERAIECSGKFLHSVFETPTTRHIHFTKLNMSPLAIGRNLSVDKPHVYDEVIGFPYIST